MAYVVAACTVDGNVVKFVEDMFERAQLIFYGRSVECEVGRNAHKLVEFECNDTQGDCSDDSYINIAACTPPSRLTFWLFWAISKPSFQRNSSNIFVRTPLT